MTIGVPADRRRAGVLPVLIAVGFCGPALGQGNPAPGERDPSLIRPPPVDEDAGDAAEERARPANTDAPADDTRRSATAGGGPEESDAPIEDRRAVAARLAEPEADRSLPMEEVIVVNESEWRLPDLGSEWRRAQATAEDVGRIELTLLPFYDPENRDPVPDLFERNSELHRVGMIEVVRLRFGGRPQD